MNVRCVVVTHRPLCWVLREVCVNGSLLENDSPPDMMYYRSRGESTPRLLVSTTKHDHFFMYVILHEAVFIIYY